MTTDCERLIENSIAQKVQQLAKKVDNLFGNPQCEAPDSFRHRACPPFCRRGSIPNNVPAHLFRGTGIGHGKWLPLCALLLTKQEHDPVRIGDQP